MSEPGRTRAPDGPPPAGGPGQEGRARARSVRLAGLAKRFGDVDAVFPLDLEVEKGELLVLLGPSGCGKSTVLRMIAGVEEPTAGEVHIGGRRVDDLEPGERDVAMVFQNYALYPHMKVRDNLSFGLRMRKTPKEELERRVAWAAGLLGLEPLLDRRPGQLSGGQRQRVALGRALVREPSVFLFDEPLSNLDARLRLEMRDEIAELHRRLGATMVFVTHDQVEAMSLGERIAILDEGRLQQVGPPLAVYERPANLFVARFIGTPPINTVDGVLLHDGGGVVFEGGRLTVAGTTAPEPDPDHEPAVRTGGGGDDPERPGSRDRPAVLGIRPEALTVLPEAPGPPATRDPTTAAATDPGDRVHYTTRVRRVEALGSELLLHLDGPAEEPWVARSPPDHPAREDDVVGVRLDLDRAHLFDPVSRNRTGVLGRRETTP